MSADTAIEWCDATFNPWWGCTRISPGCDHCYAEHHARRFGVRWGTTEPRRVASEKVWAEPVKWNAQAYYVCDCGYRGTLKQLTTNIIHGCGVRLRCARRRVFCASMADVFDVDAPEGARERLWALIRATPNLDWLLLTKRIGNAARMLPADWGDGYPNVWLGATYVNQVEFDRDWPKHAAIPARVRFISYEPALGPLDIRWQITEPTGNFRTHQGKRQMELRTTGKLHWVICGGESGRSARPMHPAWVRALRDQCAAANVPFLFKQWGEWSPGYAEHGNDISYDDLVVAHQHEWPEGYASFRVGKKVAGRRLDGVQHHAFPEVAP